MPTELTHSKKSEYWIAGLIESNTHTTMTIENNLSTILIAEGDNYLTQSAEVELAERLIATKVALSKFSTADDWKEISKAEGDQIIAEQNALRESAQISND